MANEVGLSVTDPSKAYNIVQEFLSRF
jgi:hypothetical protein